MNAATFFAAAGRLPIRSLDDLTRGRGIVVVAPHPDDESLGCGGLIAACASSGIAVRIVVVSDGVGSHPNSRRYPPPRLRELREAETRAAADALGLHGDVLTFLRLPDRFVPVEGPEAVGARETIRGIVDATDVGAVFVTWPCDPHCDHVAAATLTRGAIAGCRDVRLHWYPVWGWTLADDTEVGPAPRGLRLPIGEHLDAKRDAIAAHRSQLTDLVDDDPDGFRLTEGMLAHFAGPYETFLEG